MVLIASWTPLSLTTAATQSLTRSSHALIAHAGKAYIFGGELKARIPVDGALHTLDLSSGQHSSIQIAESTESPAPRVGTALAKVGDAFYLWGGRGGKEMKPLSGELWKFELGKKEGKWEKLTIKGDQPEERSYHVLTGVQPVSVRSYYYFNLIPLFVLISTLSTCTQDVLHQAASLHSMHSTLTL
jgi:Galactose oxidase, central domain